MFIKLLLRGSSELRKSQSTRLMKLTEIINMLDMSLRGLREHVMHRGGVHILPGFARLIQE